MAHCKKTPLDFTVSILSYSDLWNNKSCKQNIKIIQVSSFFQSGKVVPVGRKEIKVDHKVLPVDFEHPEILPRAIVEFCGGRRLLMGISVDGQSKGRIERVALKIAKGKSDTN